MSTSNNLKIDTKNLWPSNVERDFVDNLQAIVARDIAPEGDRIDREDIYPTEIVKSLAKHGYNTLTLEPEFGGGGLSFLHAASAFEEISVASAATGICLITIYQAQIMIRLFGQESLKQKYLPRFAEGLICAYALTESNHGSDITKLDTKAVHDSNGWVINGEKHFITSSMATEFYILLAETEVGVSVFAVPSDFEGVSKYTGENSSTFGLRNGPHMNVIFDNVRVPDDHMIGTEGKGVRQAVSVLNYSRTLAGAVSLGVARAAFEGALAFARDRKAFNQRVVEFQGIQWYLADMLTEIDASRLLIHRAAQSLDSGDQVPRWGSEAKYKAAAVATYVASQAAQICGAYGIMENAPFGRYIRDAKAYQVAGGSAEILKNTIAKCLLSLSGLQDGKGLR
ncbi:acyl-CoA dehydrogenase [Sneathiella chungangensis]|uniref:Acyl-CoA dehydrogenase n=1 Tax=Sneathiella chungangensis TaxID=1418234 RepID=A0A845MFP5_9PROT|nr:acyl-CoA dehydrogenase family protein [Sneathiella chungangensis]MZR22669.1 acyl-CoA dehydrogenase [Sneathiella chungangensis]